MNWNIKYSSQARGDLKSIYEYIAYTLLAEDAAKNQTQRIMKEIRSLDEMPMRYRLYDDEPWHSQGIRFLPVDNYLIFYLLKETERTVFIVRIMYGGRNISRELTKEFEF